jgi:hypothetical protein
LLITVLALAALLGLLLPLWFDLHSTLAAISATVYPGHRRVSGGALSLFQVFAGFTCFLENETSFPRVFPNVCEASNFYPLWLAAAAALIVAKVRRHMPWPPLVTAMLFAVALLCGFCLVRVPPWLLKVTAFDYVVEQRALVGIGIGGVIACCLYLDRCEPIAGARTATVLTLAFTVATAALVWSSWRHTPGLFPQQHQTFLSLLIHVAIMALFFFPATRRFALPALAAALVITNVSVNPVMRGLAPLLKSPVVARIEAIRAADPAGKWIGYNDLALPQLIKATGADVLNGTKIVPNLQFFRALNPDAEPIYNRYAHVECMLPGAAGKPQFRLVQSDYFIVHLAPDLPLLEAAGYRYLAVAGGWPDAEKHGFAPIATLRANDLWIYQSRF